MDYITADRNGCATEEDWSEITKGFFDETQFPNTLTANDSKHIRVQCSKKPGSLYFNNKHFFFYNSTWIMVMLTISLEL